MPQRLFPQRNKPTISNIGLLRGELGEYDTSQNKAAAGVMRAGVELTPVGIFNNAYTATTGRDAISSEPVSRGEQIQAGAATAAALLPTFGKAGAAAVGIKGTLAESAGARGFSSFDALKRAFPAPEGKVWHHIVEQRTTNIEKFGAEAIHNTDVFPASVELNQKIANFYSTKQPFSGNRTVREWLGTQSYAEQRDFGFKILQQFSAAAE